MRDPRYQKTPPVVDILKRYSALEHLRLDELPTTDLEQFEKAVNCHQSLTEICGTIDPSVPIEAYRNIARRIRLVSQFDRPDTLDTPTFNFYDQNISIFSQADKSVSFPSSSEIVKGITLFGKLIVGTTDGTIYVCEFNGSEYEIKQTIHEHSSEITCFFAEEGTELIVASMVRINSRILSIFQ